VFRKLCWLEKRNHRFAPSSRQVHHKLLDLAAPIVKYRGWGKIGTDDLGPRPHRSQGDHLAHPESTLPGAFGRPYHQGHMTFDGMREIFQRDLANMSEKGIVRK
jgi:hypothetical protein